MSELATTYAGGQRKYIERASPRHQVSIVGKMLTPDLSVFVDCIVRDISADGAMVEVPCNATVPGKVYLWQSKTWTIFECDVKWRKPGQIGLHFIDVASRSKSLAVIEQCGLGKAPKEPASSSKAHPAIGSTGPARKANGPHEGRAQFRSAATAPAIRAIA
jgi:PilZ domain